MARFLSQPVSRRKLLGSAAAIAAGATFLRSAPVSAAPPGKAIQVLVHDEVQEGAAFGRGRALGPQIRAGVIEGAGLFESSVIESPFPFTHVGLHWRGSGPGLSNLVFELRTSLDGTAWTDWQSLHIEAGPLETPVGDTFASLVNAPRYGYIQYRTNLPGGASLGRVIATFLNSVDGPAVETLSLTPLSRPAAIDFSREEWGCDEALRFRGKNKELWPRMFVPLKKLVVHHTASGLNSDGAAEVRAIYTYHARTLGWGDIGYNALIDRSGRSYEGRYGRDWNGGREIFSTDVVAGHASAHNYGSSGIALIGNFEDESISMGSPAVGRLLDILEYVGQGREIDPKASSPFLLSNDSWNPNLPNVSGHRDCNATACPGANLYPLLAASGGIRDTLQARLAMPVAPSLGGSGEYPAGSTQSNGNLSFNWSGGSEYSHYLEGWQRLSSGDITYISGYASGSGPDLAWSGWSSQASVSYTGLTDGRYTFHARRLVDGKVSYQGNRTVLISGASSGGGGGPGKGNGNGGGRPW
jgi:hypothetical protein